MKATLAGCVRAAIRKFLPDGREFSAEGLAMETPGPLAAARIGAVRKTLRDFLRMGEIERVRPGFYRATRSIRGKPELQQVMWDILRFRQKVTIEDLVELSGATANYAKEWLENLTRCGVARHAGSRKVWRMISDPVAMPRNDRKAWRQREGRRKKRERETALCGTVFRSAEGPRMEVNGASEDGEVRR
ncbi:MAG: hypothetical protein HY895_16790 [Deltaproteobacteria bacterium]|nr:hypothetical protein [Deltaproteobacteria bacterium]